MRSLITKKFALVLLIATAIFHSCTREKALPAKSGYPSPVAKIILTQCVNAGCHNAHDKELASGLNLENWNSLMAGSGEGAVCIPYAPDESHLFLHCNTYDDLGFKLTPTMPSGGQPLSHDDMLTLKTWILNGAPNDKGEVAFSHPASTKIYITNQGCDLVAVVDAQSGLVSRFISVGNDLVNNETPHRVVVSPDGQYYYVVFSNNTILQKFSTADNSPAGTLTLGTNVSWNTFYITPDSRHGFAVNWSNPGSIAYVDLQNMTLLKIYSGSIFTFPHGITGNATGDTLYITAQYGNFIFKLDVSDPYFPNIQQVSLVTGQAPTTTSSLDPHEIQFTPDHKHYFVTCQKSNEVRVLQTSNDSLIAIIPTGTTPQEMSISITHPYLFVSTMEDADCTGEPCRGSVAVINYQTFGLVKTISEGFFQPHGLVVDDKDEKVFVASRNVNATGPAPHHTTKCAGNQGYLSRIDLNTLEVDADYSALLSVDPYSVDVKK